MQIPSNALTSQEASIEIAASPEAVYDLVSDVTRMGEWSPESTGADWVDGGSGNKGDWFDGHNRSGEREWTRACQVASAERGQDFTFVVGGVEDNCTWWSYEMEPVDGGTRLTERWWLVNKTPGMQAATQEQFEARIALTETMLKDTIAAVKKTAES
ncbi:MAG: SRPBCC family protein [Acidimicrobiales bacterium]